MASTDATPLPIKNQALRITFGLWLTTGLINSGASGLDSEVSIDGGTFADCTNEATEIASGSGTYYLDLTSGELNGDTIAIQVKSSTTNAITYKLTIYPSSAGKMQVDLTSILATVLTETSGQLAGGFKKFFNVSTPTGTLNSLPGAAAGASNGLWILGTNNTAAITIGAITMGNLTASAIACSTITASGAVAFQSTFAVTGTTTLTGNVSLGGTLGVTGTTTFATINTGTIATTGNRTISGTLTVSGTTTLTLASGTITAASIATGAFIAAVWDGAISGHTTSGTFGGALNAAGSAGDPWATALPGAYGAGTAGFIVGTNLDAPVSGITVPTAIQNADALLKRDWTGITGEASYSTLNALRFLRNKWVVSGTGLNVFKEDGSTLAWAGVVSVDPTAEPIVGNAPS